ncbi:MAG: chemotaxis protein CheD [Myxococcaceae bacterium]|nr:chemotaxis protein CheD [Myxococcaceae bacterium]MCI0669342.1 chemotaxis protein CheD [Myxococcaceae bacterium]
MLFLLPGALVVTEAPMRVTARLDACVSVCLWDARQRLAGVSLFSLPRAEGRTQSPDRYGDTSTRLLLEQLRLRGSEPSRLEAKVFGGAHLGAGEGGPHRVGERNVAAALETLRAASVRLTAADVGGGRGRRLVFLTDQGRAWVRHL